MGWDGMGSDGINNKVMPGMVQDVGWDVRIWDNAGYSRVR